jgi:hypothetical protein
MKLGNTSNSFLPTIIYENYFWKRHTIKGAARMFSWRGWGQPENSYEIYISALQNYCLLIQKNTSIACISTFSLILFFLKSHWGWGWG